MKEPKYTCMQARSYYNNGNKNYNVKKRDSKQVTKYIRKKVERIEASEQENKDEAG